MGRSSRHIVSWEKLFSQIEAQAKCNGPCPLYNVAFVYDVIKSF